MPSFTALLLLLTAAAAVQARGRLVDYALVLAETPVAQDLDGRAALASSSAGAKTTRIQAAQRDVRARLAERRIRVDAAVQLLSNAIFVTVPSERAAELRAIPGVARVQRLPRLKRHLDRAIDLVKATQAWTSVGGAANAGAGVKIGIIDTGIDRDHPGFRNFARTPPAGFPKGETAYTNNKIIVARSYVAMLPFAELDPKDSRPDDVSPRDRTGHGTAIAMIAAGQRNQGPAGAIQGVAPQAWLGNYKVFGSPGVNDYTKYAALAKALDEAFRDGMDIVTLALGEGDPAVDGPLDRDAACSSDGRTVADCDVRAQAVELAVRNGMVVVASAGNGGDTGLQYPSLATVHTPGTAPSAITVGAATNSHILFAGVTPRGGSRMYAIMGQAARFDSPITAPLKDVGGDGQACAPLPSGSLAGAVALVQRGTCVFSDKLRFAQEAGAIAAIIYQQSGGEFPVEIVGAPNAGIPSMGVGAADGATLKSRAAAGADVTLDPALLPFEAPADEIWFRSSRGPAVGTMGIKPEVVAVGTDLYTATQKLDPNGDAYDATGYNAATGTSYAAGMAAGAAALVKQKYPSLRPAQIKSLVVNTATQDVTGENGRASVLDVGAGKLNVAGAVTAPITAEPATLSFGVLSATTVSSRVTLDLTNIGAASATLAVTVSQRTPDARATLAVSPATMTLPAGQRNTVTVTLQGQRPAAGIYEGFVEISTAGAPPSVHVPYLYVVGDGVPYDAIPVLNPTFTGVVNDTGWLIGMRVIDRYGVPVVGAPITWKAVTGGRVVQADVATATNGLGAASVNLGAQPGDQVFTATVGSLVQEWDGYARPLPAITANGVLNAASNDTAGGKLAAGSYISIYGSDLADALAISRTASLPFSLATTSVSFDAPGISVPGRLHFVSPGQVNVQIPWEVEGQASVEMKVSLPDISSALYTLQLGTHSPGIFVRGGVAAALDTGFRIIDASNPARRGQAIQLYVNGLGPVDRSQPSGEPAPSAEPLARTRVSPVVTVGGRPAQVIFSGLAPGNVGLYQVNAILAADTPTGNQPVVLSIGGVEAKPANMPVQ